MRFGVQLPQYGAFATPEAIVRMARAAEALGWDAVWASDHIIVPREYAGRFSDVFYDIVATLGFVAAHTRRVRLGTSVFLVPYRHPIMLAKQIASLDSLSAGRTIIGIAPGWMEKEFQLLDLPFDERARRHDEAVRAMVALWTSENPVFEGEFYRFADLAFAPKPIQRPHPPLWVGGNNRRALRRTVELGTGWHPITSVRIGLTLEELRARIGELRSLADERGRRFSEFTISVRAPLSFDGEADRLAGLLTFIGSASEIRRRLERCAELGVSDILFDCFYSMPGAVEKSSVDDFIRTMERFTNEVKPKLPG